MNPYKNTSIVIKLFLKPYHNYITFVIIFKLLFIYFPKYNLLLLVLYSNFN